MIALIRSTGVLPVDFAIEHYQETAPADADRLVVKATIGDYEEGGCRPNNVAVEIERVAVTLDNATIKAYDAAVDDVMADPLTTYVAEEDAFSDLFPLPPEDEQQDASNNTRSRVRTFNFLALEALVVSNSILTEGGDFLTTEAGDLLIQEAA